MWDYFIKVNLDPYRRISRHFMMNIFKHWKVERIVQWNPYTYNLDSTINILQYLFYHIFIHSSIPPSMHKFNLCLMHFKTSSGHQCFSLLNLQHTYHMTIRFVYITLFLQNGFWKHRYTRSNRFAKGKLSIKNKGKIREEEKFIKNLWLKKIMQMNAKIPLSFLKTKNHIRYIALIFL